MPIIHLASLITFAVVYLSRFSPSVTIMRVDSGRLEPLALTDITTTSYRVAATRLVSRKLVPA